MVALLVAGLIGFLAAVQARINGELGVQLGDGVLAAAISFGSGLLIVLAASLAIPVGRGGLAELAKGIRNRSIPWWMLAGGAAGALTVATQGLAVAVIGVSLFTVGVVAGQSINGLVLDRIGYGPAGVVAVTVPRLIGGALALAAVVLTLSPEVLDQVPLWMLLLPFLAGVGIAWQQATNGRLRRQVGTALTATLVNFAGGALLLALAATVHIVMTGSQVVLPSSPWLYLGGALGVIYIFLAAALVAHTGVLLLGLGSVVGQLLGSVILDALWPAQSSPGLVREIVVVSVASAAVIVVAVPWRHLRGSRRRVSSAPTSR